MEDLGKYKIYFYGGEILGLEKLRLEVLKYTDYFTIIVEYPHKKTILKSSTIGIYLPNINFNIDFHEGVKDISENLRPYIKQLIGNLQMNPDSYYAFKDLS